MRVAVDPDRCQGHTLCAWAAPDVFRLRDVDGHAFVDTPEVPTARHDAVRNAALNCPEGAITISE
jgi:ferredoxin